MRANQVGEEPGGVKSSFLGDFSVGRALGVAYRRITVLVSLATRCCPCASRLGATEVSSSRRSS